MGCYRRLVKWYWPIRGGYALLRMDWQKTDKLDAALLELVSKMPEQNDQAGQVHKSPEVLQVVVPAGYDAPELVQPGEEALHLPAPSVAPQGPPVLGGRIASVLHHAVRCDHFDSSVAL